MNSEYKKELIELLENHPTTAGKIIKSKNKKHLYDYVMKLTCGVSQNISITMRALFAVYGFNEDLTCVKCGKKLDSPSIKNRNAENFRDKFTRFCSAKCECTHESTRRKVNETNIRIYGCKWSFQSDNNKNKARKTMNDRYGCDYAQQNNHIKQKQTQTMVDRYGVATISQTESGKKLITAGFRRNMYKKFLDNEFVKPEFSEKEYFENGDRIQYGWKCLKCGTKFKSFRNESWFKQGQVSAYARCPKCYPDCNGTSFSEKDVYEYIKEISENLPEIEVLHRKKINRTAIKPQELDIIIKIGGQIRYAVEYDGLYWHSDKYCPRKYHLEKTEYCLEKGIQLIHIFESDWLHRREIVKSRLKNMLGVYDQTVFARKCRVSEISYADAKQILDQWHIQGACPSSVNIALTYGSNEIIAVMTFGKSRFSGKHQWELLRFCSKPGFHIPGGASRLFKYFERKYDPKSVVSYADRRWSLGNIYARLGFQFVRNSPPNYWYFRIGQTELKSRMEFQKHKLKDVLENFNPEKSEYENMALNGYARIFDCGNMVFEKTHI